MAIAPTVVRIPRLQSGRAIVDANGMPMNDFLQAINTIFAQIEASFNGIDEALAAAGIAQGAALKAQQAADAAAKAASDASAAAAASSKEQALTNSYIVPSSVLKATPTTITIAAHTRYYTDGTSVAVNAGSVAATLAGDTDYVSYSDPNRTGGAVSYQVSTNPPTQAMNVHVVGAVTIPSTGTANGGQGPERPGTVQP